MALVCDKSIMMFAKTVDYSVDRIIEIQHCIECELTDCIIQELINVVEKNIDMHERKYGKSGQLMGELGYYHPSRIIEHIYGNVKRGRVYRKKPDVPVFVYDFNQSGDLLRVLNMDLGTVTYADHCATQDVYVSINRNSNEIESVIIVLRDENMRVVKWIQFHWYDRMKIANLVSIELYRSFGAGEACTTYDGICDAYGVFRGLATNEYTIVLNESGRVISVEYLQ